MAGKSRPSFLKRQKEQKRMERATQKNEAKKAKKVARANAANMNNEPEYSAELIDEGTEGIEAEPR